MDNYSVNARAFGERFRFERRVLTERRSHLADFLSGNREATERIAPLES